MSRVAVNPGDWISITREKSNPASSDAFLCETDWPEELVCGHMAQQFANFFSHPHDCGICNVGGGIIPPAPRVFPIGIEVHVNIDIYYDCQDELYNRMVSLFTVIQEGYP